MPRQLSVAQSRAVRRFARAPEGTLRRLARGLGPTLARWFSILVATACAVPSLVHAQTAPAAPVLKVVKNTVDTVELSWTVPPGAERMIAELMTAVPQTVNYAATTTKHVFRVTCTAPNKFRVTATNAAGSTASNIVSTSCPCGAPPGMPTSFTVQKKSALCSAGAIVNIVPAANADICVSSYSLFDGGAAAGTFAKGTAVTTKGLASGVAHSYTIKANNPYGTGPALPPVSFTCQDSAPGTPGPWTPTTYQATDISVGAGKLWFINGETIYQMTASGPQVIGGVAARIAVDQTGVPWVMSKEGVIYKRSGSAWASVPGLASDIGIGANGYVWIINKQDGVPSLWNAQRGAFVPTTGAGTRIAVGMDGYPWVVNAAGALYHMNQDGTYTLQTLKNVSDISVSHVGNIYAVGTNKVIYRFKGTTWVAESGVAGTVVAAGAGNAAWVGAPGQVVVTRPQ